jgi:hypothetical protein
MFIYGILEVKIAFSAYISFYSGHSGLTAQKLKKPISNGSN